MSTLNSRMLGQGYRIECIVKGNDMEKLLGFSLNVARGYYEDYKIIPENLALEGSEWRAADSNLHIIYAKVSPSHPDEKEKKELSVRMTRIDVKHKDTGNDSHIQRLENL